MPLVQSADMITRLLCFKMVIHVLSCCLLPIINEIFMLSVDDDENIMLSVDAFEILMLPVDVNAVIMLSVDDN